MNSLRLWAVKVLLSLLAKVRFRGKGTILLKLCPRDREIEIDLFGYRFQCDLHDHIQRSIFLFGYDEAASSFVRQHLHKGDTFVDVGANVGFYSLLASATVGPQGRVIAVEPNPTVARRLAETIARNNIKNITLLNIGLGRQPGKLTLYTNSKDANQTASMLNKSADTAMEVPICTLDLVAAEQGLSEINYLKIDVDGFEPDVFAGAKELFAQGRIKAIQSEFCDFWLRQNGTTCEELHESLSKAGFRDAEGPPIFEKQCLVDRYFLWHGPSGEDGGRGGI